jgi:hypothetical protein
MARGKYYRAILDTLQGRTEELRTIPPERLDWTGVGALLALIRRTSGKDRTAMIRSIGQVIRNHPASPGVIAELVNIASSLDLAEVEPEVRRLQATPFGDQQPLRDAITNFLAFRALAFAVVPETARHPRGTNTQAKVRKTRTSPALQPDGSEEKKRPVA